VIRSAYLGDKDEWRKQTVGVSLVPPEKRPRTKDDDEYPRKPWGLFWVRHEHCRERKNVENLNFYNLLTPSEILQVFMGRTRRIGT
jgi:hypothetical protein